MTPYWPSLPQQSVATPASTQYTPYYASGTPLGDLINTYGQYLKPYEAYSSVNPYDSYSAPLRETFNFWAGDIFRPEYEQRTINPWRRDYSNMAATSNMSQMGRGQKLYQDRLREVEQPYYDQMESYKSSWEDLIRKGWEEAAKNYTMSPTTGLNYK